MRKIVCLWIGFLSLCGAARPVLAQTSAPDPAEWAPPDAVFYLGVADIDQLWADYQKTSAHTLMKDPALTGLLREFDLFSNGLEKFTKRLAKALETEPAKLKNPFRGPLALYFSVPQGGKPGDMQTTLVAGVGNADLMKQYYAVAVRKLRQAAENAESVSAGSQTIDVFTAKKTKPGEEGDTEEEEENFGSGGMNLEGELLDQALNKLFSAESMPPKLALCLTGERLIVASCGEKGSPEEQVKAALRQTRGGGESLANTDDYKALLRQFKPLGPVRFLINLPRVFELAKADADEETRKLLPVLGADCLRSVIGHLQLGGEAYDARYEALALMSGERSGLAKLFSLKNRDLAPPPGVAADTSLYVSLNVNPVQLLDEVERMLRQFNPETAEEMRKEMESMQIGPDKTVNLRKDFLEHLAEPMTYNMSVTRPYTPDSPQFLVSVAHRNKEAVEKFLASIPGFTARDVRGTQMYDFMFGGGTLAALNDRLVAGNTLAVEAALRPVGTEDRLSGAPTFKRAAQAAPPEAWGVLYLDWRRLMEAAIGLAEKRKEVENAQPTISGALSMRLLDMYAGTFKDDNAEQARKALRFYGPQILTAATTPDGVRLTVIQLKPEKE